MLLQTESGAPFASGAAPYIYQPVTSRETINRVWLNVQVGSFQTQAYLDTGAVYMICGPVIAGALRLAPFDSIGNEKMLFRGISYQGSLYRVPLTLLAELGRPIEIDVTAFLPEVHNESQWPSQFPCILGMYGCFERVRFALDPFEDMFYFGSPNTDY